MNIKTNLFEEYVDYVDRPHREHVIFVDTTTKKKCMLAMPTVRKARIF